MAYGDIDAGMTEAEKQHLAELEATCKKQSGHISKLGKQIAKLEEELRWAVEVVKATKSMAETCLEERAEGNGGCGACSICCGESTKRTETAEAELAELKEAARLDAAQKFLFREFAMRAESDLDVIQAAWCDFDAVVEALRAERDKLRDYAGHTPGCPGMDWQRHPERGCSCGWAQTEATLGEGGGG